MTCAFGFSLASCAKDLRSEFDGSLEAKGEPPDDDVDDESSSELLTTWICSSVDSTFDIVVMQFSPSSLCELPCDEKRINSSWMPSFSSKTSIEDLVSWYNHALMAS